MYRNRLFWLGLVAVFVYIVAFGGFDKAMNWLASKLDDCNDWLIDDVGIPECDCMSCRGDI